MFTLTSADRIVLLLTRIHKLMSSTAEWSKMEHKFPCEIMLQSDNVISKGYEQRNNTLFLQFIYSAGSGGEGSFTFSAIVSYANPFPLFWKDSWTYMPGLKKLFIWNKKALQKPSLKQWQ